MNKLALDHWLNPKANIAVPQLVCVFTDEPLFSSKATDLYRTRLRQKTEYQRHVIDLDRYFDTQAFQALFAEVSLFGDLTLVDLRLSQPKLGKDAEQALAKVCEWITAKQTDQYLLVTGPKLNKTQEKSAGFVQLLNHGTELVCKPVSIETFPAWLSSSAKLLGLHLNRETCMWLTEKTEGNLLAAQQTLEKLALEYQGEVPIETVQGMASNAARFNVFDLGQTLLAGDTKRIVRIIEGLQAEGEAPTLVLWALQEEIRAIQGTQSDMRRGLSLADACRQNRIWGVRQTHIAAALKRHSAASLQTLTTWCYAAEKTIKGMKQGNPWTLFEIIGLGIGGINPPTALGNQS